MLLGNALKPYPGLADDPAQKRVPKEMLCRLLVVIFFKEDCLGMIVGTTPPLPSSSKT